MDIAIYTFHSSMDTLPTFNSGYTYTYTDVDNGDNTKTRTIISDTLPTSMNFNGRSGLTSISKLDISGLTRLTEMFYRCSISKVNMSNWDTSNITRVDNMFSYCSHLTELDLSHFNTSKITNMNYMFYECTGLISVNLSNWDTSKVTSITSMFGGCNNLTSVIMENNNVKSINDIIAQLPTRTSDNPGTLIVPNPKASGINTSSAQSKYWDVVKPPQYTFDKETLQYFISKIKDKFAAISDLRNKVDKEDGKVLSSNNFSDDEKDYIDNSFNDVTLIENALSFYSTSESGEKIIIKTFDLDI